MKKAGTEDERHQLTNELRSLRKGDGVTPSKLGRCPTLLACPLVRRAEEEERVGEVGAATIVVDQLLGVVGVSKYNDALRNAYALSVGGPKDILKGRRLRFSDLHVVSTDTVENWENRAIDDLVALLLENRPPAPGAPNPELYAQADRPNQRVDALDSLVIVNSEHAIAAVEQRLAVRALRDGVDSFRRGFWSDARPGDPPEIDRLIGCEIREVLELPRGGHQVVFGFPAPLSLGQVHEFGFQRNIGAPDPTPYWYYQPQYGGVRLRVRVQFTSPAVPTAIWAFFNAFTQAIPGLPTPSTSLAADRLGYVEQDFSASAGAGSGIGWWW